MPFVEAAGRSLGYEWIGGEANGAPVLVFLHEGLGSIRQWRDFPARVAAATGCRAFVYDRYGYGQSDVLEEARRDVRFMHDDALIFLPEVRKSLGIEDCVLIGHSDGASIALIHASEHPVAKLVLLAPHVFVEDISVAAITEARDAFPALRDRMGRYHRDAERKIGRAHV